MPPRRCGLLRFALDESLGLNGQRYGHFVRAIDRDRSDRPLGTIYLFPTPIQTVALGR